MANRTPDAGNESERLTRHRWIDPLLDAVGWPLRAGHAGGGRRGPLRPTARPTALRQDDRIVGIVEAKKLTIGPQNALTQTRLAFTEQAAFFEEADGPAVREQCWRALLESLGTEVRRSMPGRPQ